MAGWFTEKLNRYNVSGIDESCIDDDLLTQQNPFLGQVVDIEEFKLIRIADIPQSDKEETDGSSDNQSDLSS